MSLRGHEVHFISYANPVRLEGRRNIFYHEVEVATYPLFQYPPYTLALASRMVEVSRMQKLDVLHCHYAIPHSVSAYLARAMMAHERRLPFVTTLHGTDITLVGQDRSYHSITKFSIEESDAISSISQNLKDETVRVFGVEKHIDVVYNFICPNTYRPQPERRRKRPTLMHISNFRPVKRVLDCIRIFAVVRRHLDADLLMVGDGPDRGSAERLAFEMGVSEHVQFLGKQNPIYDLIPEAHVLLLPSETESFGLVALEAMSCGVVPVATRVGGVPELVREGVDGFLSPVGDIEKLARHAITLLTDDSLRERMAVSGRESAELRFHTNKIIPQYEALYERVVA